MPVTQACTLVGIGRSSFYRDTRHYQHYTPATNPIPQKMRHQPAALTEEEKQVIEQALLDDWAQDLSVLQCYWRCFDSQIVSCSQRTFYRVATALSLVGDRRKRRRGNAGHTSQAPRVLASAVGDAWSWDVTELKGPGRERYKCFVAMDVFSRFPVAWRVEHTETGALAFEMFSQAFTRYGPPMVLHSDNGGPMRSREMTRLISEYAGTTASFSRPRVSDDNPFSESLFKTLKYALHCPDQFTGIDHARAWVDGFLGDYARHHRHSGIGYYTPHDVFHGHAGSVRDARQEFLDRSYLAHPQRYRQRPHAPRLPGSTGINHRPRPTPNLSQTG